MKANIPKVLWTPSSAFSENSNLENYRIWLKDNYNLECNDYHDLWKWSTENIATFWESIWKYFEIKSYSPYQEILSGNMPDAQWFKGSMLNYAEHQFRNKNKNSPAILFKSERLPLAAISWDELEVKVSSLRQFLIESGVQKGDRVVAFLPNIPEASIAFMAVISIGAIWSSCSPDFGVNSVIDRFAQIEPKVLFAVDGYQYNGKPYDKIKIVEDIVDQLPTLKNVVFIPYLNQDASLSINTKYDFWENAVSLHAAPLVFEPVPFGHPIWILYSSGTTGAPKAITHSHGGVLLEHYKYLAFHNDVHPGERFFWFSTTGWMMWNFVQASFLMGATIVLYDGSPAFPDLDVLWKLAEEAGIHHFGTSAPYMVACMKKQLEPGEKYNLSSLRSIGSTGAPLPPEAFDWAYETIKEDLWLCSMSGGTDVCSAFVGGCPTKPVYLGEIQCRALGCAMEAFDEKGEPIINEVGEMVITQPMPSMPIYFWNDEGGKRYQDSYFDMYPGIWRHGDWLKITSRGSLVIFGRSDATLNRQGIRIGTAEIYRTVNKIPEIKDSLIVNLELKGGRHYMPLFVVLKKGAKLNEILRAEIKNSLRKDYSPRHVPDDIIAIKEIPYTISGKKLEAPVKKILMGMPIEKAANIGAVKNPEALEFFEKIAKETGQSNVKKQK
ncbi:MAG: acetoacetate--CoA ligase [Bacteroidetes bacterium]|nr:acetoacetate--CoA ligase [Bacteroidota bacterium]